MPQSCHAHAGHDPDEGAEVAEQDPDDPRSRRRSAAAAPGPESLSTRPRTTARRARRCWSVPGPRSTSRRPARPRSRGARCGGRRGGGASVHHHRAYPHDRTARPVPPARPRAGCGPSPVARCRCPVAPSLRPRPAGPRWPGPQARSTTPTEVAAMTAPRPVSAVTTPRNPSRRRTSSMCSPGVLRRGRVVGPGRAPASAEPAARAKRLEETLRCTRGTHDVPPLTLGP